jgi:8-oxo-dGTP diphosphatase
MEHSSFFPDCFYRLSVKGIVVRDGKALLVRESDEVSGKWELPGGGLDFGEDIKAGIKREVEEEMKLKVKKIADKPTYLWTYKYGPNSRKIGWYYVLVLIYQIELESLDFTPSAECIEIKFFSKEEMKKLPMNKQMIQLPDTFNPEDFKEDF